MRRSPLVRFWQVQGDTHLWSDSQAVVGIERAGRGGGRIPEHPSDEKREARIDMEIVVDLYTSDEQALAW